MPVPLVALIALGVVTGAATAQTRPSFMHGQNVSPAYEGWEEDDAGRRYFLFGYMNRNWEEELDVPTGPDNFIEPGGPDAGQPTHFLPRRNRFVFRVPVPEGFDDDDEMVWTLTTAGVTEQAYATVRLDYLVNDLVQASEQGALGAGRSDPIIRANTAPVLRIEGDRNRRGRVGAAGPGRRSQRRRRAQASAAAAAQPLAASGAGHRRQRDRAPGLLVCLPE